MINEKEMLEWFVQIYPIMKYQELTLSDLKGLKVNELDMMKNEIIEDSRFSDAETGMELMVRIKYDLTQEEYNNLGENEFEAKKKTVVNEIYTLIQKTMREATTEALVELIVENSSGEF